MSIGADLKKIFLEPLEKPRPASTLKKCSACGADISSLANKCPKCGHPSTASQIQAFGCVLFVIGLAILLFFFLVLR